MSTAGSVSPKSPWWRRIAAKAVGYRQSSFTRSRRLPYTITAVRRDEKMRCVRDSALVAFAKARIWESEGWDVLITDEDGRTFGTAQLDAHVTAYRSLDVAELGIDDDDLIGPKPMKVSAQRSRTERPTTVRARSAPEAMPA
jgi:hypothetical protein